MDRKFDLKYLNVILTIIAILLILIFLKPSGGISSKAHAQETNFTYVRDEALSGATKDIAEANREISKSIDKLSDSVSSVAQAIEKIGYNLGGNAPTLAPTSIKSLEESGKIEVKKPAEN